MSEAVAIQGIGLERRYGGFRALKGVDITVRRGEIRGLIGPNGAGKSTLIDVLSGRVRGQPGQVLLGGRDISRLKPQERRKLGLARSFQRTSVFGSMIRAPKPAIRPFSSRMGIISRLRKRS